MRAYGFTNLGKQKDWWLVSYKNDKGTRINYYRTTGTIVVQDIDGYMSVTKNVDSDDLMEKILMNIMPC